MQHQAELWSPGTDRRVHCALCAHRCDIGAGRSGVCGVRTNIDGTLYTSVYGNPIAVHIDPIEKKPLYHFLPGTKTLSLATIGCNFRCSFCQNWRISQRRSAAGTSADDAPIDEVGPEGLVEKAIVEGCPSISYTYTEPTVFFEYAMDTSRIAHSRGLKNIFVTNGYMTREAADAAAPFLDAANVDLKSFRDEFYRKQCKARLTPVLDTIRNLVARSVWVEVTTLIIPGENDSDEELTDIARFLKGISVAIPWHVTRFHPDYHLRGTEATPRATVERAREIGLAEGLVSVHTGNL